jgi:hypothetical protein
MSWKLGGQVPGQEFLDTVDWVIGDALQDMAKIEFGVEIVELGRAEQAVNGRRAFAAGIGSGKETSVITLNPAIRDRVKSGHREWPKT